MKNKEKFYDAIVSVAENGDWITETVEQIDACERFNPVYSAKSGIAATLDTINSGFVTPSTTFDDVTETLKDAFNASFVTPDSIPVNMVLNRIPKKDVTKKILTNGQTYGEWHATARYEQMRIGKRGTRYTIVGYDFENANGDTVTVAFKASGQINPWRTFGIENVFNACKPNILAHFANIPGARNVHRDVALVYTGGVRVHMAKAKEKE